MLLTARVHVHMICTGLIEKLCPHELTNDNRYVDEQLDYALQLSAMATSTHGAERVRTV